jgi:hypothetical protein
MGKCSYPPYLSQVNFVVSKEVSDGIRTVQPQDEQNGRTNNFKTTLNKEHHQQQQKQQQQQRVHCTFWCPLEELFLCYD